MQIKIIQRDVLKEKPKLDDLKFGKYFTDYMFIMDYDEKWKDARIVPFDSINLNPASLVFHYAIESFEGMKAYRNNENIYLFRPEMNAIRFNRTNKRLTLPMIDENIFLEAINEFLRIEKDWIFNKVGYSLYLRPFMIATEETLGLKMSKKACFMMIASPVPNYYFKGNELMNVYVESKFVRSVIGGTGDIKCGGNYANSVYAQTMAVKLGFDQVLWLDGIHHKYIEEVGTMNIMFVIDDKVFTPKLNGSILPGITRDSIITILNDKNIEIIEDIIDIHFLIEAIEEKRVSEAFGCGTAALIAPIKQMTYQNKTAFISNKMGPITSMLYDELTNIQWGLTEDYKNWRLNIKWE